ncbi:NINE protein, partial [Bacteroides nordii]
MKSKSTAVLFAIILGGLGIHHFYLGDTKKGLCYL